MLQCTKCGRDLAAADLPRFTLAERVAIQGIASMLPGATVDMGALLTPGGLAQALNVRCAVECEP